MAYNRITEEQYAELMELINQVYPTDATVDTEPTTA